jgi:hypothetical protein
MADVGRRVHKPGLHQALRSDDCILGDRKPLPKFRARELILMIPDGPDPMEPVAEARIVISCLTTRGIVSSVSSSGLVARITIGATELMFRYDLYQWINEPQGRTVMSEEERIEPGPEVLCA